MNLSRAKPGLLKLKSFGFGSLYGMPKVLLFTATNKLLTQNSSAFSLLCARLALLCFAKIGGGSAKQRKSCGFSLLCARLALSLHPYSQSTEAETLQLAPAPPRIQRVSPTLHTLNGQQFLYLDLTGRGFCLTKLSLHGATSPLSLHGFGNLVPLLYS